MNKEDINTNIILIPKLSILICSLKRREAFLYRLRHQIEQQLPHDGTVEVLCQVDNGEISIGDKRNNLLKAAKGEYICFIDDDDEVSPDYIFWILKKLNENLGVDCCSLHLKMTIDGHSEQDSYHSIKYKTWYDEPEPYKPGLKRYFRNPNHLNVVKREHALATMFPSNCNIGEDRDYSARIQPLLKTEAEIFEPIYYYRVRTNKEC